MATFKYFADIDGAAIELKNIWHDGHVSSKAVHFSGLTPEGTRINATRRVEIKTANPSRHECNARCMGASGKSACECSCGGANHGRGGMKRSVPLRRSICGVQFVFHAGQWTSESGYRLHCGKGLAGHITAHWQATGPSGAIAAGMTAEEAYASAKMLEVQKLMPVSSSKTSSGTHDGSQGGTK